MKYITLAISAIVLITLLIMFLKPDSSDLAQTPQLSAISTPSTTVNNSTSVQPIVVTETSSTIQKQPEEVQSSEPLFNTKSDMSIQPIDPETDPGNQIIDTN